MRISEIIITQHMVISEITCRHHEELQCMCIGACACASVHVHFPDIYL